MTERSLTPNITVTIGHHTRIYFAYVKNPLPHLPIRRGPVGDC